MLRHAVFASALCLALAVPAAASTVSVGPYTASATSPFVVPVSITGASRLDTFTFDLFYNAADFRINTGCDAFGDAYCDFVTGPVTPGSFYSAVAGFPPLFNPGFILLDPTGGQTGQLIGVNGAWQDPGPAPSGDGVLAFVEFVGVPGGNLDSPITLGGSPPTASVPEPSTSLLVLAGLIALAVFRFGRRAARFACPVGPVRAIPGTYRATSPPRGEPPATTSHSSRNPMNPRSITKLLTALAACLTVATATAQTTANGPYYATPSWDQTFPTTTRFVVLANFANQAVLDRETGLVWARSPNLTPFGVTPVTIVDAQNFCSSSTLGGRMGWRLPTAPELTSLFDPSATTVPPLPSGHPFVGFPAIPPADFLSTTPFFNADDPTLHLVVQYRLMAGVPSVTSRAGALGLSANFICVRAPS